MADKTLYYEFGSAQESASRFDRYTTCAFYGRGISARRIGVTYVPMAWRLSQQDDVRERDGDNGDDKRKAVEQKWMKPKRKRDSI